MPALVKSAPRYIEDRLRKGAMNMDERYRTQGYAVLPAFLGNDLSKAIVDQVMQDALAGGVSLNVRETSQVLRRKAFELNSNHYVPLRTLHWGLTPTVAAMVGREIAPTYCLFRIYAKDDICRVHADTPACEHSISLMLASDGDDPWSLDIATESTPLRHLPPAQDFGAAGHVAAPMRPGDAVLYQGVTRRHGRVTPNPNKWSAHLFLHWVSRDGPYAENAAFAKVAA
jgi:hypothetical protein